MPFGHALAEREALLTEAERIAHMGSWVWDVRRNEVRWSDELFRILGYTPGGQDAATIEAFYAAVHRDDVERIRAIASRGAATGVTEPAECRIAHRDGTYRDVRLEGAAVRDSEGRLIRLVGTVLDITAAKRAEATFRRTVWQLEETQQMAGLGSWIWDPSAGTVEWSSTLYSIVGIDPAVPPSLELFVSLVHPEDRHLVEARVETAPIAASSSVEYRVVRPDGAVRHLHVDRKPVHSAAGRLLCFVGTVLDVTERKLLDEQLRQVQKMEALGTLAGGVAHDFNNYLHVVLGLSELLRRQLGPGDHQHTLDQIKQAAERCAALTRQLLAFGRRQTAVPRVLDLGHLVSSCAGLLRTLVGEGIRLELEVGSGNHCLRADPAQLEQILINMATNARDAMPSGGTLRIEVGWIFADADYVDLRPGMSTGDYVVLIVEDDGTGIPDDVVSHVFEPFFTTKERGRGTGLGLSTVYGIVKECGGHIDIRSDADQGTMFRLYFPGTTASIVLPDEPAISSPIPGGHETVLLAEDDPDVRRLTRTHLEEAGYSVLDAGDGETAARCAEGRPDIALLVTDVRMPKRGGHALARLLLADRPSLKVIFMSGYAEPRFPGHLPTTGSAFLPKPFTARELLVRVRELLDAPAATARATAAEG